MNQTLNLNTNTNPRKVLVVDDDPIIRDMMSDILESEGYAVTTARNGFEALKLLHGDERYLVFLDVMMPNMDGKEVCERLDADPLARQRHAIILMSALDRLSEVTSCKVEGIIPKPFVVEDVLGIMGQYMG
jgi:two-component system, OmpR family, alkaline phosphatase synthesis response regulator PhoP